MPIKKLSLVAALLLSCAFAQSKPKLTLDEFFNSVGISNVEISPEGNRVVIVAERADWDRESFRTDLYLYRDDTKSLIQLTQSGHDSDPKWSPDGKWIAFTAERESSAEKSSDADGDSKGKDGETTQLYLISPDGGEAFAITQGGEDVHAFAWSADSKTIYFSTRLPWTKAQKDSYKREWNDVLEYRTAERGDAIFALDVAGALDRHALRAEKVEKKENDEEEDPTPGAPAVAALTSLRIDHIEVSPDGAKLAFLSNAVNQRQEKYEDVEIYTVDLVEARRRLTAGKYSSFTAAPHRVTTNQAQEVRIRWAPDNRHVFFLVEVGNVNGPYLDLQPHLYWIDTQSGQLEQWAKNFIGPIEHYDVTANGILVAARIGTEVQAYTAANPADELRKVSTWAGTYSGLSRTTNSNKIAFTYSSLQKPDELYIADSLDKLNDARPVTQFNKLFTERELPQGKPYQWKADDGTTVEGMLIYPPGKFEQKHLPMFTLIHGGPIDADGNHFEADWYQWASLAATNGWLVFEPNYRGSSGYGDKFLQQIVPQLVSRPGKDILEGVDALVKDGIADADHLTIGGYSYGGYMTNWLITQTTRFKAAVTGAGAVEHVGNWGNDDTTYDDAYYLGGRPWEVPQRYHDEGAIFYMDKVKTPTHMVAGADDIRVAVLEDYLLEHALYSLGIPNKLLVFPGEGHSLSKNPWHGKIKVREELKWLQKYGGVPAN